MHTLQHVLAMGLQLGFAGKTKLEQVMRGGFALTASHFTEAETTETTKKTARSKEMIAYHDEWAADRTGGGQELVRAGEQVYTRVYAGGTIAESELVRLGTSKKEIMTFLISQLSVLGENTRLHQDCGPLHEGEWEYAYRVTEKNDAIPYTCGKEEIRFQGNLVFVHHFVMCPVE